MKLKIIEGGTVAVHYTKDNRVLDNFFNYPENGCYRKLKVIKIKRHWLYLFKEMILLSDGVWYEMKQITPVFRVYGY